MSKEAPQFCTKCGQELVYKLVRVGYYANNGAPRTIQVMQCPDNDGRIGSDHDWYSWGRPFLSFKSRWRHASEEF